MPGEKVFSLSGTDAFFLALEHHPNHRPLLDQYCLLIFEVEGMVNLNEIQDHTDLQSLVGLNSWTIHNHKGFGIPSWRKGTTHHAVNFIECPDIQNYALNTQYNLATNLEPPEGNMISLYFARNDERNTTTFILKWNHLIMDAFGALSLMQLMDKKIEISNPFPVKSRDTKNIWILYKTIRFVSNTSAAPLFSFDFSEEADKPIFDLIEIEKSEALEKKMHDVGATIQQSNFFLAAICQSLQKEFPDRAGDFWIPVPLNARKRGTRTPLFSNQLSSYFFRVMRKDCSDIKSVVSSLNNQMKDQLAREIPHNYALLLSFMRMLPSWLSFIMIRGWKRRTYASFLYTFSPSLESLEGFANRKVIDALNMPPNSFPPGLSFVIIPVQQKFKIAIMSRMGVVNKDQVKRISERLKELAA